MTALQETVIAVHKQEIEKELGMKCIILLVEKIDELLPKLEQEEIASVIEKYIPAFRFGAHGLKQRTRNRELVDLRKIYCILAQKAGYSLREIGLFLNGRDHTTIIHNIEKGMNHLETEHKFKTLFHWIQKDLMILYEGRLNAA
jgi:chromosomal replication initiation ATPase DnaA